MFPLRRAIAEWSRQTAELAIAVGEFDRDGMWALDGATSMQAWLRDCGLAGADVHFLIAAGRRAVRLPALAAAWRSGELSKGQVQAIVKNVPDKHMQLFSHHEDELVPTLVGLSVDDTVRVMREWSARADALADDVIDDEPVRELHLSKTLDDRYVLDGSLDPEGGLIVQTAIDIAQDNDFDRPAAQRRGDALVEVAKFFLDHHDKPMSGKRNRPHVTFVVDADKARDKQTVERVLCDAGVSRVLAERVAGATSHVLDYGRSTRVIPKPLWEAVAMRDRRCRFPGCERPSGWCEAHHVRWFRNGGETSLRNLALLCSRHHHLIHSTAGPEAKLLDDATFVVTWPDGTERTSRPPP